MCMKEFMGLCVRVSLEAINHDVKGDDTFAKQRALRELTYGVVHDVIRKRFKV